jgi:hypothetical protein
LDEIFWHETLLRYPMLAVTEPPDAAADEDQEDKDNGEVTEYFILPEVERPPQFGELIAEPLDLEFEVGVAGGVVVKVAVGSPFVAVVELQSAVLSLVAGRIRARRIIRKGKVEAVQRCVAGASVAGEEEPGPFSLRPSVKELELSVRDAAIAGIRLGRLRTVALADDLVRPSHASILSRRTWRRSPGSVPKIS